MYSYQASGTSIEGDLLGRRRPGGAIFLLCVSVEAQVAAQAPRTPQAGGVRGDTSHHSTHLTWGWTQTQ